MALYCLSIDALALVAATAKSALELGASASGRAKVCQWWVGFDGNSAAAVPVKVEVGRFSAAVTTATSLAGFALDPNEPAAVIVTSKHSTSTEGAGTFQGGEIHRISPTTCFPPIQYPLGREWMIGASGFWRMRLTAAAAVNVTCGVIWEE